MTGDTPYDGDFFTRLEAGARRSARRVVPLVLEYLQPKSVVDVGCGLGAWLSAFREHGVSDLCGVDGAHVLETDLPLADFLFKPHDLTQPLHLPRRFDLVICLEVAEHLPPACARSFVESLTRLGPVVLFSAAIPGQGGTDHRNEQWPDYWADHFSSLGYLAFDVLRPRLWADSDVEWWYVQNVILYVAASRLHAYPRFQSAGPDSIAPPRRLVHPAVHQQTLWLYRAASAARDLCTLLATLPGVDGGPDTAGIARLPSLLLVDDYMTGDEILCLGAARLLESQGCAQAVPAGVDAVIDALDAARAEGAEILVFAWPSFWWLDHVHGLRDHLDSAFPRLLESSDLLVFDLRQGMSDRARVSAGLT